MLMVRAWLISNPLPCKRPQRFRATSHPGLEVHSLQLGSTGPCFPQTPGTILAVRFRKPLPPPHAHQMTWAKSGVAVLQGKKKWWKARFFVCLFVFLFIHFKYFLISPVISSLIHWLFKNVLFNFQNLVNSPFSLLLISNTISL